MKCNDDCQRLWEASLPPLPAKRWRNTPAATLTRMWAFMIYSTTVFLAFDALFFLAGRWLSAL